MKKMINGKRYDTNAAKKIAEWTSPTKDTASKYTETLYRKRTGEFFLHGWGNEKSPYGQNVTMNAKEPGEKIIPMNKDEAWKWAIAHADIEEFAKHFEDDGKVTTSIMLSRDAAELLAVLADSYGMTKSRIIEDLIRGERYDYRTEIRNELRKAMISDVDFEIVPSELYNNEANLIRWFLDRYCDEAESRTGDFYAPSEEEAKRYVRENHKAAEMILNEEGVPYDWDDEDMDYMEADSVIRAYYINEELDSVFDELFEEIGETEDPECAVRYTGPKA
jgi:hypothetical protein